MRIIGGLYRSRVIKEVNLASTRPTQDKIRGAIFNSLATKINSASVLDLFSGSGAMALEAISRGARLAICVDKEREACKIISENAKSLGLKEEIIIHNNDYNTFLGSCGYEFDIIFLDPPYQMNIINDLLTLFIEKKFLKKKGIIVCEIEKNYILQYNRLVSLKDKTYGRKRIVILQLE